MTLDSDDGSAMSIERMRGDNAFTVKKIRRGEYAAFDRCPICEEPLPKSREHVPPRQLGGVVLTLTCTRCNNEFGSRVENELQDWFDDATHPRYSNNSIPGDRKGPRLLARRTPAGEFVLLMDEGKVDPAIAEMLSVGEFTITHTFPSEQRVRIALLKSAYLAACSVLGVIPASPRAEAIRALLVEVRDAPRDAPLPASALLDELTFHRAYSAGDGEVWLVGRVESDELEISLSLAGTILVSWPLEPVQVVRVPTPDPGATTTD